MTMNAKPKHDNRIPCLDGIRAVSILGVLIAHLDGTHRFPAVPFSNYFDLGNFGVRVFFVISGYLITTLLINEHAKTGSISLVQFYFRRTFRIFPAFYVFIAVLFMANSLGWTDLSTGGFLHAVTYTSNYDSHRAWELGHLWSLAVEEQFYLLWPAAFLFFRPKKAIVVASLTILALPIIRVLSWILWPSSREGIGVTFHTVADTLATGCVLALVKVRADKLTPYVALQKRAIMPLVWIGIAVLGQATDRYPSISLPVGQTVTNIGIALFIDSVLRNPTSPVGRVLDTKPLAYIGVLSYSLYLFQQPFLNRDGTGWVHIFPQNLVLTAICALASYHIVEKPMFQVRQWLSKVWFSSERSA